MLRRSLEFAASKPLQVGPNQTGTLKLAGNKTTCQVIVARMAPRLLELPGVGPITAAITLLAFSHPGRIHSEAAFAALAGACPIPASSGNTVRHRLNRGGDRRLNRALHTIVLVRTGLPRVRLTLRVESLRPPGPGCGAFRTLSG